MLVLPLALGDLEARFLSQGSELVEQMREQILRNSQASRRLKEGIFSALLAVQVAANMS